MDDPHDEHNIWEDLPPRHKSEPTWTWAIATGVFVGLLILLVSAKL